MAPRWTWTRHTVRRDAMAAGHVQPPSRARGTGNQKLPTQAAAGASPALLAFTVFTTVHYPLRGLTSGLSARRRASLPPDTATRGWTASQLPSTPWAALDRPIRNQWAGYAQFGPQRSERGCQHHLSRRPGALPRLRRAPEHLRRRGGWFLRARRRTAAACHSSSPTRCSSSRRGPTVGHRRAPGCPSSGSTCTSSSRSCSITPRTSFST
jgi:hypothetical protein